MTSIGNEPDVVALSMVEFAGSNAGPSWSACSVPRCCFFPYWRCIGGCLSRAVFDEVTYAGRAAALTSTKPRVQIPSPLTQKTTKTSTLVGVIEPRSLHANGCATSRKPLDVLIEGLYSQSNRGDSTPIELFLAGVRVWPVEVRRLCEPQAHHMGSCASAYSGMQASTPRVRRFPWAQSPAPIFLIDRCK